MKHADEVKALQSLLAMESGYKVKLRAVTKCELETVVISDKAGAISPTKWTLNAGDTIELSAK
jgi:hypothetical protein